MKTVLYMAGLMIGLAIFAGQASADIVHDEAANGELSNDLAAPTVVNFAPGGNTVIGQVGDNGQTGATNGSDADYFTVNIGLGEEITSILIDSRSGAGSSFFGYTEGVGFSGQGNDDIDGFVLFNNASGEVLDDLTSGGSSLGPGDYSFWLQETSAVTVDYSVTFNVVSSVQNPLLQ